MLLRRLIFGITLLATCVAPLQARLTIEITEGQEGALPIAIVPFHWGGGGEPPEQLSEVVRADLARSGQFAPLPLDQLPARPQQGQRIDFSTWRERQIDNLVVGRLVPADGAFMVQFQLFDVLTGEQLAGYNIPALPTQLRQAAHRISDIIYQTLTGQRGAFNTHVAYITVSKGSDGQRRYQLAVADADGYNEQIILTSAQPLMSPAWSPQGRQLAYVSFEEGRPTVFVQNIITGAREQVAAFEGINSAPAWSPDGQRLALTLSRDGNPEIYILELASRRLQRITNNYAIDTEAVWSPDGDALIFTSDRGGVAQLYRAALDGSRPQRLTFDGRYNARASWSPNGQLLALVHRAESGYVIGLQPATGGAVRPLSQNRLDESPSFAPNGSMVIYATEVNGRGVLEVAAVEGSARQRLTLLHGDVREPAWSPYID